MGGGHLGLEPLDGDAQAYAVCSHGRIDEGLLEQDRLFILDGGEVAVERVRVERREVDSEVIKSPEP